MWYCQSTSCISILCYFLLPIPLRNSHGDFICHTLVHTRSILPSHLTAMQTPALPDDSAIPHSKSVMQRMHLFRPAHDRVADSRDHINPDPFLNTSFQDNISLMTVDPAEKNDFHSVQNLRVFQIFSYAGRHQNIKFFPLAILTDQGLHPGLFIIDNRRTFRRKRLKIPCSRSQRPYPCQNELT